MFCWNVKLVELLLVFSYFLVCAQLQSPVETEVIGSHEPVVGVVGEDIILPCQLKPPFYVKSLTVEWKHYEDNVHFYRSLSDDFSSQHEQFKGRTSLFHDEMIHGNISLKLTNVTTNDAGDYTCYVPKLHSQVRKGNLSLVVQEQRNINSSDKSSTKEEERDKDTVTGGIIGGGVGGGAVLLVIIVIIVILIWKRDEVRDWFSKLRRGEQRRDPNVGQENIPEEIPLQDQQRQQNPQQLNGAEVHELEPLN